MGGLRKMNEIEYSKIGILIIGYQEDTLSLLSIAFRRLLRPDSFRVSQILIEDFSEAFPGADADLIVLELQRKNQLPFFFAQKIRNYNAEVPLIFFSDDKDKGLVFQCFPYHPYFYLRKATLQQDLRKLLQMYLEERFYPSRRGAQIRLLYRGKSIYLPLGTIQYVEAEEGKSIFYTENEKYEIREPLKRFADLLSQYDFFLINRNILINIAKIHEIARREKTVTLSSGDTFSISRRKMPGLIKNYHNCRYWKTPEDLLNMDKIGGGEEL